MLKIRYVLLALALSMYAAFSSASAGQVSVRIGVPNVSIGFHLGYYPDLILVPGYPVYYAPNLDANYFFYDGLYWIFIDGYWYVSSWYDGPWALVEPEIVPVYILLIPVRYYRHPPLFFHGWRPEAPPRWGEHWGRDWERRRSGWDRWDRSTAPAPAPLPAYQRLYSKDRYPQRVEQQHALEQQHYRYQPREPAVRQHYQERAVTRSPAVRDTRPQDSQRAAPRGQEAPVVAPRGQDAPVATPRAPSVHREKPGEDLRRPSPTPTSPQQTEQREQREQREPRSQSREEQQRGKDATPEPRSRGGQQQDRGRGRDRNE